jgi:hypothetical protein
VADVADEPRCRRGKLKSSRAAVRPLLIADVSLVHVLPSRLPRTSKRAERRSPFIWAIRTPDVERVDDPMFGGRPLPTLVAAGP